MTFSGPKACRGLMKDERILPHFLHSAIHGERNRVSERSSHLGFGFGRREGAKGLGCGLTRHRRRERVVDAHLEYCSGVDRSKGV